MLPPGSQDEKIQSILNSHHHLFLERKRNLLKSIAAVAPEQQFYNFLDENKAETHIQDPLVSYKIEKTETDNMGITHIRAVQQYKGIEIYGSESVLHEDIQKERFTGSVYHISQDISETPQIDTIRALNIAQTDLKQFTHFRELTSEEKKLLDYESPDYSLVFYDTGNEKLSLAWIVTLRPNLFEEWKYFINAANGLIIRKYNNTRYDGTHDSYRYRSE